MMQQGDSDSLHYNTELPRDQSATRSTISMSCRVFFLLYDPKKNNYTCLNSCPKALEEYTINNILIKDMAMQESSQATQLYIFNILPFF